MVVSFSGAFSGAEAASEIRAARGPSISGLDGTKVLELDGILVATGNHVWFAKHQGVKMRHGNHSSDRPASFLLPLETGPF